MEEPRKDDFVESYRAGQGAYQKLVEALGWKFYVILLLAVILGRLLWEWLAR